MVCMQPLNALLPQRFAATTRHGFSVHTGVRLYVPEGPHPICCRWLSVGTASCITFCHLLLPVLQGGTCVLVGDDAKRIAEAEQLARREIGCRVLRSSAYFQPEGHVQVGCWAGPVLAGTTWVCRRLNNTRMLNMCSACTVSNSRNSAYWLCELCTFGGARSMSGRSMALPMPGHHSFPVCEAPTCCFTPVLFHQPGTVYHTACMCAPHMMFKTLHLVTNPNDRRFALISKFLQERGT